MSASTPSPRTRCPAIHVASVPRAPREELEPALQFLKTPSARQSRRFPRGTVQRDGRLDFCKQGLGAEGVDALVEHLGEGHAWLSHVLLGTNGLGDAGAERLGRALREGLRVSTLYLGCNAVGPKGAAALAEGLAHNEHVRALWLKRNPLGEEGLSALLEVLPHTRVRTLDLTNCELGDEGVARLAHARLRSLAHVFLGANGLTDAAPLSGWLADSTCSLRSLFLGASRLGDVGVEVLADSATRLHSLDLGSNALTPRSVEVLAAAELDLVRLQLGDSPSALALGERHNALEGAELHRIVRSVLREVKLRELGLRGAGMTSRDARRLVDALATVSDPPRVLLGAGIARRLRASAKKLSTRTCPAPTDVLRIASVYR